MNIVYCSKILAEWSLGSLSWKASRTYFISHGILSPLMYRNVFCVYSLFGTRFGSRAYFFLSLLAGRSSVHRSSMLRSGIEWREQGVPHLSPAAIFTNAILYCRAYRARTPCSHETNRTSAQTNNRVDVPKNNRADAQGKTTNEIHFTCRLAKVHNNQPQHRNRCPPTSNLPVVQA